MIDRDKRKREQREGNRARDTRGGTKESRRRKILFCVVKAWAPPKFTVMIFTVSDSPLIGLLSRRFFACYQCYRQNHLEHCGSFFSASRCILYWKTYRKQSRREKFEYFCAWIIASCCVCLFIYLYACFVAVHSSFHNNRTELDFSARHSTLDIYAILLHRVVLCF